MRGTMAVSVVGALLLLLLSFSYFEPVKRVDVSSERAASSFAQVTTAATAVWSGAATVAGEDVHAIVAAGRSDAVMADLGRKMRAAAQAEDFDEAKRLKLEVELLRRAAAAKESPALAAQRRARAASAGLAQTMSPTPAAGALGGSTSAAAPTPILKRDEFTADPAVALATASSADSVPVVVAAATPPSAGATAMKGCLVGAWDSVWVVFPNGSRSFLPEASPGCRAKATRVDLSVIPKNEGLGKRYILNGETVTAAACANEACKAGYQPPAPPMEGPELSCVRSALETPAQPVTLGPPQTANEHTLSRELVARYASPSKQIIVTFVNAHYLGFALTWVYHLRQAGCNNFLVGAMDAEVLIELRSRNIQAFTMVQGGVASRDLGWGSPAFKKAQQVKVQMFADVLDLGFDALLADIDAVFIRNPLPYLLCFPLADVLVSSDHLHNSTTDGGLELPTSAHATMNVGMLYVRARPQATALLREWDRRCSSNLNFWEQAIFNELAKDNRGLDVMNATLRPHRLFTMYNRTLIGGILPVSLFSSGHTGFVQRMGEQLGFQKPYAYHATFQFSGTRGKKHRFRERMVWLDPPAYHDASQGYLRFQPVVPDHLMRPPWVGVQDTQRHLELIATQMAAVRDALALAHKLGRLLIMPRLVCGYDKYWSGMPEGKIPGSALTLPIWQCPMDHVFELERWPEPEATFREHSFLDNPRTPDAVKRSVSRVHLPALAQPAGDVAKAIADAGGDLSKRVLDMTAVPHWSQVLTTPEEKRYFEALMPRLGGVFCCNPKGAPPIPYIMPKGKPDDRVGVVTEKGVQRQTS